MSIKAVIVDDEYLARQRMLKLLSEHDEIEVVAEAKSVDSAYETILERSPDVVFLDIQMPGKDGFELLRKLPEKACPIVVFVTAHDQYAIDAFRVNALDYLLKPIDEEMIEESIKRIIELIETKKKAQYNVRVAHMLDQLEGSGSLTSFSIKENGLDYTIKADDVQYIESAGNYVILHTTTKQYLYRHTMSDLADQLDQEEFFRIHRSFILNKRFVKHFHYLGNNEFSFDMKNGKSLKSAKGQKNSIKNFLQIHFS